MHVRLKKIIHAVFQERLHCYFLNDLMLNPADYDMNILHICPPHMPDRPPTAILLWEIQNSFSTVLFSRRPRCISHYIISEENKL